MLKLLFYAFILLWAIPSIISIILIYIFSISKWNSIRLFFLIVLIFNYILFRLVEGKDKGPFASALVSTIIYFLLLVLIGNLITEGYFDFILAGDCEMNRFGSINCD
jgi:hypothetical protein